MNAMPNSGVARLTIGIDTNAAITSPAVNTVAAFCLRIALASAGGRNRIAASSKYSRPSSHAVPMKNAMKPGPSIASAQPSPDVANQLSSHCRPIASTTISTSANPIERHRIERIGGDRICDSALTAASNMIAYPLQKTLARGRHAHGVRQEPMRVLSSVERFAAYIRAESRDRNNHDDHRRRDQAEHAADAGLAQYIGDDEA